MQKTSITNFLNEEFFQQNDKLMGVGVGATLRRIIYVVIVATVSTLILGKLFGLKEILQPWKALVLAVIAVILLSEGNVIINRELNKRMPWYGTFVKRIRIQLVLSFLWMALVFLVFGIIASRTQSKEYIIAFAFGTIFVLFFNNIMIMRNFAYNWRLSAIENEKLKQAKLQSDYKVLQSQLNPHFLFNSFSVLISEIQYNPGGAVEFTQKMADVYRYVLQQRDATTIPLKHELNFISGYMFLHKTRMGVALDLVIDIKPEHLSLDLPPLTLQGLVENAIKHNRASDKQPLQIRILSEDNAYISVVNNLNPKTTSYSTGLGLENLVMRYKLLTRKEVVIIQDDKQFKVSLPLLNQEELQLETNKED